MIVVKSEKGAADFVYEYLKNGASNDMAVDSSGFPPSRLASM